MILNFSVPVGSNRDTTIYNLNMPNGEGFPLACVGRDSYIVGGTVTSGADFTISEGYAVHNLQIGNFVSIAHGSDFCMGLGHNYYNLATGVSDLFESKRYDGTGDYKEKGQILIQNDVWLGHNVTVMPGVVIHNGAVVAANSHVVSDVPPYAIVGGNPAKLIRYRFNEEVVEKLLKIRWWNWDDDKIKSNNKFFRNENIKDFCNRFYNEAIEEFKTIPIVELSKLPKTFLFFVDFKEPYALWERVITEFIKKFKTDESCLLILYIDEEFADSNHELAGLLPQYIKQLSQTENYKCSIRIYLGNKDKERAVFKKADYYISSRSKDTILHSDYAYENNVRIVSGVDVPIF